MFCQMHYFTKCFISRDNEVFKIIVASGLCRHSKCQINISFSFSFFPSFSFCCYSCYVISVFCLTYYVTEFVFQKYR